MAKRPPSKKKIAKTREEIDEYLTDRHCSLWGRSFDIIGNDQSRERCIDFIFDLLEGLDRV